MSHNYVVTANKPTNVTHALVGCFTGPNDLNLLVSRCTRLEVYLLGEGARRRPFPQPSHLSTTSHLPGARADGLTLVHDVGLYGRVATMQLWRPAGRDRDMIFLSTERYQFCLLSYDAEAREFVTEANGDISDKVGRRADSGQIALVEPNHRMIGLHLYDGLFKVIPAAPGGKLQDAFNIRLDVPCRRPALPTPRRARPDAQAPRPPDRGRSSPLWTSPSCTAVPSRPSR